MIRCKGDISASLDQRVETDSSNTVFPYRRIHRPIDESATTALAFATILVVASIFLSGSVGATRPAWRSTYSTGTVRF